MAVSDLADSLEALGKLASFWLFLGVPSFRARQLKAFRSASLPGKLLLGLEAVITTAIGLGLPALLVWLIVG